MTSDERDTVMRALVKRVISAGNNTSSISEIILVSNDEQVVSFAEQQSVVAFKSDRELNHALHECTETISSDAIIVAHGDLAHITSFDTILSYLTTCNVVIAPDRHREGTNIIAHKKHTSFHYQFGNDSLRRHITQCIGSRYAYVLVQRAQYEFDVDTPEDFLLFKNMIGT